MAEQERLPIKLILPKQGTEKKVPSGRGKAEPFREVNQQYRDSLARQISTINEVFSSELRKSVPIPLRIKLLKQAIAKSHRPEQLFSKDTCPIVGAGSVGELFVKASSIGIKNLNHLIQHNHTAAIKKEISCIDAIEAVTPSFRMKGQPAEDILKNSPKRKDKYIVRIRLFNYGESKEQGELLDDFYSFCKNNNIKTDSIGYSSHSYIYSAEIESIQDIQKLSKVIGIRSVSSMPIIQSISSKSIASKPYPLLTKRGDIEGDIPAVVVVDTGIDSSIADLETWVTRRQSSVAPQYRNPKHGTFIAGLICWGKSLNPTIPGIGQEPCGVFDLQLLPNDDLDFGDVESLSEQEFLTSLENALKEHANEYKVWNISLGTDEICSLDSFSEFAEELDNLQEKYSVSFVISAGNYENPPLLNFPRHAHQIDIGRITTPADSVLGITVGSVAHFSYPASSLDAHCPSAFSRHGAGPNYIIKPDLVQYGGGCSVDFTSKHGIVSVTKDGIAEDFGTSFSAPLVSRNLAQIYHQITPVPSPVLAKALLIHHSRDPRTGQRVPDGEENFFGFGLPAEPSRCLECSPHMATLIFDDILRPGYFLEWNDFPYPASLKQGNKFFGEIWMTIAFAPKRGSRWGSEYCETHIDAHFGVYRKTKNRKTGNISEKFVGLVPPEHRNPGILYESYQIEKLRKWAPVRTYHGYLGEKGQRGEQWRLMVRLLSRHSSPNPTDIRPQPFSLIITIADPEKKIQVYDEMSRHIRARFQVENLAVRAAARIRATT